MMKILFLMLHLPDENGGGGMYIDLAEGLQESGHHVTIMAPDNNFKSSFRRVERGIDVVRIKCRKTLGEPNLIKKGIGLALMPRYYRKAYNRYLKDEKFDWIFMPTPPITLIDFVQYVKKLTNAKFYLILRDIHPQSAHSIGLIKYKFMYDYLAKRAKRGYELADYIGCMSQGNIDFVYKNYPDLDKAKGVILYNWLKKETNQGSDFDAVREKYKLNNKIIVLFGGTIGLGQRIENIAFLATEFKKRDDVRFLIIGKGVEKERLISIAKDNKLDNIIFLDFMPKEDYLSFMSNADIGLISINENYSVPTCPSKAVAYMSLGIPIFAMINPNNDYCNFIEDSGAGIAVVGNDRKEVVKQFERLLDSVELRSQMSASGQNFYNNNLTVEKAINTINSQLNAK